MLMLNIEMEIFKLLSIFIGFFTLLSLEPQILKLKSFSERKKEKYSLLSIIGTNHLVINGTQDIEALKISSSMSRSCHNELLNYK